MLISHRVFSALIIPLAMILNACSDNSSPPAKPDYDFTVMDTQFQGFIDNHERLDGISVTLVDAQEGTVYEAAFGDHTLDTVVLLASTSKAQTVTLLMALNDDPELDFDMETPIENYLPWEGLYGDRTTAQLVSNTSGIPGLRAISNYGAAGCQFSPGISLEACAQIIYSTPIPGTQPAGTVFDYGGSQWQLSGAVAQQVTNSEWAQIFEEYIGEPCDLEVFSYGNPWSNLDSFDGNPASLIGRENPHLEGGAISNLQDYAKLLLLHLREGRCGETQVASPESLAKMRENRSPSDANLYGMGWFILPGENGQATIYYDPGAFGAIAWLDMERNIGGYVAIDDYTFGRNGGVAEFVFSTIIPMQQAIVDETRATQSLQNE